MARGRKKDHSLGKNSAKDKEEVILFRGRKELQAGAPKHPKVKADAIHRRPFRIRCNKVGKGFNYLTGSIGGGQKRLRIRK